MGDGDTAESLALPTVSPPPQAANAAEASVANNGARASAGVMTGAGVGPTVDVRAGPANGVAKAVWWMVFMAWGGVALRQKGR